MEIGLIVVASFVSSLALTPLARSLAERLRIVSRPDGVRRLHAQPTPVWGGVGVCGGLWAGGGLTFLLGPVLGLPISPWPLSLMLSAGLVCLVGMIDDRYSLNAWGKLPGQTVPVLPLVLAGLNVERISGFGWELELGWFAAPWTMGWLLLGINALNLLDGSDGLASTVGFVMALTLAIVAAGQGTAEVTILALTLAGALAGFLRYNLPPARVYLGDCGSTLIGFVVAALALRVSCTEPNTASLPGLGLLVFVPLLDTGLAILRRLLKGQAIWSGDRGHLHHQLQPRGLSKHKILLTLGGLSAIASLAAALAVFGRQELLAVLLIAGTTSLLVYRQWIAHQEWNLLIELLTRRVPAIEHLSPGIAEKTEQPLRVVWTIGLEEQHGKTPYPAIQERNDQERRAA